MIANKATRAKSTIGDYTKAYDSYIGPMGSLDDLRCYRD